MPTLGLQADDLLTAWPVSGLVGILDLEYTSWEGTAGRMWSDPHEWREIVQLGAILVDAEKGFAERASFEAMVKPERNPVLSEYFTALTGITQTRLEAAAEPFEAMLRRLEAFLKPAVLVLFNGNDGEILRENCAMRGLVAPWIEGRGFNLRPLLARTSGRPPEELTSSGLPALAGVEFDGRAHSGLADCRAIAAALRVWLDQAARQPAAVDDDVLARDVG
jgi:inhibitor of KinA sporulation pathway (predicted exonuclease)